MKNRTKAIFGMTLTLALGGPATWAQAPPSAAKPDLDSVKTFYLANVTQQNDANDIATALRNLLDSNARLYFVQSQNAILLRTTPEQIVIAQKIVADLDRPKKTYRLVYTINESDGGRRIGTQRFAIIVLPAGRTNLKQGSRVPIVTGAYNPGVTTQKTEVTYIDVGLNIDASLDESVDGVRLRTKVEQSSLAEEKAAGGTQNPVIRQTSLEGTSILTPGKPLTLGSLDVPGSTRHLDVEVVLELVR